MGQGPDTPSFFHLRSVLHGAEEHFQLEQSAMEKFLTQSTPFNYCNCENWNRGEHMFTSSYRYYYCSEF